MNGQLAYYENDYGGVAMPEILAALQKGAADGASYEGYGLDDTCARAADALRALCDAPEADVHFIPGGTGANMLYLDAALRSYEAVLASAHGHIHGPETGAVEATGHKILEVPSDDEGKILAEHFEAIERQLVLLDDEHHVTPRVLYISQTTELGGLYRLRELEDLRRFCDAHDLKLFVDGARLAVALTAPAADMTLPDLARLADAFYFGGTKAGLLYGEALVLLRKDDQCHFRQVMKRRGMLLAKGVGLGLQFEAFFRDGLYLESGRRANAAAAALARTLTDAGYTLVTKPESNQIFVAVTPDEGLKLEAAFGCLLFGYTEDGREIRRFVTDYRATTETDALWARYRAQHAEQGNGPGAPDTSA